MADQVLTYEDLCARVLIKPFLDGPNGRAYQGVMGSAMDEQLDRLYQAKRVRYPHFTPTDALFYLAAERGLERINASIALSETEDEHRERLHDAWGIWQRSGSQAIHIESFGWAKLRNVRVYRRKEHSTPKAAHGVYVNTFARSLWSQFDVLVNQPHPWQPKIWGAWVWGDGTVWGLNATPAEINLLRRLGRDHKSAHDTGTYLHVNFGNNRLWGDWIWGDGGLWGGGPFEPVTIVIGEEHWTKRGLL